MKGVAQEVKGNLSAELLRIAKMHPGNAERDMHPLLIKHGLEMPVKISLLKFGLYYIHVVRMSSWFAYALEHKPSVLLGGFPTASPAAMDTLKLFWQAYRSEEPDHEVYKLHADRLHMCIPFYLFSDDGRGLRKSKLLVINFETPFGRETGAECNELGTATGKKLKKPLIPMTLVWIDKVTMGGLAVSSPVSYMPLFHMDAIPTMSSWGS